MPVSTLILSGVPGEFSVVDARLWNLRRVVSVKRNGITQFIISNGEGILPGMNQCQYIPSTSRIQFSSVDTFNDYFGDIDAFARPEKVHIIYIP